MEPNNRLWLLGTAIVAAGVIGMGWFFGAAPQLEQMAANNSDRELAEMQNSIHEGTLARMKAEYDELGALKTELASLRQALPATDDLSTFIGELHSLEQKSKVTITSITASDGQPYVAAEPAQAADAAATSAAAAGNGATSAAASGTQAAAPATPAADTGAGLVTEENFVAIPIQLLVTGSRVQVMDFVDVLQKGERLFLVTALSVTENITTQAVPDADAGTYTGNVSGFVYVLLDAPAAAPAAASEGATTTAQAAP